MAAAIIGIIAAIAWPTFEGQLQKNRRKEGIRLLLKASQEMHQCRTDNGDYTGCTPTTTTSKEGNYTIAASDINITGGGEGFTLAAKRVNGDDAKCTSLTIDNLGRKGHTGSAATDNACWGE